MSSFVKTVSPTDNPSLKMIPTKADAQRLKPSLSCPDSKHLQSHSQWLQQLSETSGGSTDLVELLRSRARPFRRPSLTKKQEKKSQPLCRVVVVKRNGLRQSGPDPQETNCGQAGIKTKVGCAETPPPPSESENDLQSSSNVQQLQSYLVGTVVDKADVTLDPSASLTATSVPNLEAREMFSVSTSALCKTEHQCVQEKDIDIHKKDEFQLFSSGNSRTHYVGRNSSSKTSDSNCATQVGTASSRVKPSEHCRTLWKTETRHEKKSHVDSLIQKNGNSTRRSPRDRSYESKNTNKNSETWDGGRNSDSRCANRSNDISNKHCGVENQSSKRQPEENAGTQHFDRSGETQQPTLQASQPKHVFPQLKVLRRPVTITERLGGPQPRIQPVVLKKLKTFSSTVRSPLSSPEPAGVSSGTSSPQSCELKSGSHHSDIPQPLQTLKLVPSKVEVPHSLRKLKSGSHHSDIPQPLQTLKLVPSKVEVPHSLRKLKSGSHHSDIPQPLQTLKLVPSKVEVPHSLRKLKSFVISTEQPQPSEETNTLSRSVEPSQPVQEEQVVTSPVEPLQALLQELETISNDIETLQKQLTCSNETSSFPAAENSADLSSEQYRNNHSHNKAGAGEEGALLSSQHQSAASEKIAQDRCVISDSGEDSSSVREHDHNLKHNSVVRRSHQSKQKQRKDFLLKSHKKHKYSSQDRDHNSKEKPLLRGHCHVDQKQEHQFLPKQLKDQCESVQRPSSQNGDIQSLAGCQQHGHKPAQQCLQCYHSQETRHQHQTEPVQPVSQTGNEVQKHVSQAQEFRQQQSQKQDSQSFPFRQHQIRESWTPDQSSPEQDPRELVRRLFRQLEQREELQSKRQPDTRRKVRPLRQNHSFDDKVLHNRHSHCQTDDPGILSPLRRQNQKAYVGSSLPCLPHQQKPGAQTPEDKPLVQPVALRRQNQKRLSMMNRPYSAVIGRFLSRDSPKMSRDNCRSLAVFAQHLNTPTSSEDDLDMGYSEDFTSSESITPISLSRKPRTRPSAFREQSTQTDSESATSPFRTLSSLEETEDGESTDAADTEVGNIFALSPISSWTMSPPYCAPLCRSTSDLSCPPVTFSRGNIYLPMAAFSRQTSSYNLYDADSPHPDFSPEEEDDGFPPFFTPALKKRASRSLNLRKLKLSALKKWESLRTGKSESEKSGGRGESLRHRRKWEGRYKRNTFFSQLRVNQDDLEAEMTLRMQEEEEEAQRQLLRQTETAPSPSHKSQLRANVVKEIITAETEYVKHLRDVIEGYLKQARKRPEMFPVEKVTVIFSNIEVIYDFATKLLGDLRIAVNMEHPHLTQFGHCFLNKAQGFEIYSEYCNNHPAACEELREMYRVKRYRHFFEACRLLQDMTEIPLEGFLLTPVQKICKYHLQLAELLKYTPEDHTDYPQVRSAVDAMKNIAKLVNERKRKMESIETLAEWQSLVDDWEGPDILDDSSELIYSGELNKINPQGWSQERYFFLFDHQLVYCKKDLLKKNSFGYKGRISMDHSVVVPVPDGKDAQYNVTVRNAFKIHDQKRNKWYLMVAKTPQVLQRWLKAFADERRRVQDDAENNFNIPSHLKQAIVSTFKQKSTGQKSKVKRKASRNSSMRTSKTSFWVSTNATLPRSVGRPPQHSSPPQANRLMSFLLGTRQK